MHHDLPNLQHLIQKTYDVFPSNVSFGLYVCASLYLPLSLFLSSKPQDMFKVVLNLCLPKQIEYEIKQVKQRHQQ